VRNKTHDKKKKRWEEDKGEKGTGLRMVNFR
jgi:hypothetical protein